MKFLTTTAILLLLTSSMTLAADAPGPMTAIPKASPSKTDCEMPVAALKAELSKDHFSWTKLNDVQYAFVRGIYYMHPDTPPELPLGESAALLMPPDKDKPGKIVFVDGDMICFAFNAPVGLESVLAEVADGTVFHKAAEQAAHAAEKGI